ncbi:MAG: hypothetical protein ACI4QH_01150, partial [Candidatus Fimimonas sp.]
FAVLLFANKNSTAFLQALCRGKRICKRCFGLPLLPWQANLQILVLLQRRFATLPRKNVPEEQKMLATTQQKNTVCKNSITLVQSNPSLPKYQHIYLMANDILGEPSEPNFAWRVNCSLLLQISLHSNFGWNTFILPHMPCVVKRF